MLIGLTLAFGLLFTRSMRYSTTRKFRVFGLLIMSIAFLSVQNCGRPLTYDGQSYLVDPDQDGIDSIYDNCPNVYNPAPQADSDGNGIGDACDQEVIQPVYNVAKYVLSHHDGVVAKEVVWEYSGYDESTVDHYELTYTYSVNYIGGGPQGPFVETQVEKSRIFYVHQMMGNYQLTIVAVDANGNKSTPVNFTVH